MSWFRGDESPSSQAAYGGKPQGGLPEQLAARQASVAQAQAQAEDNGGGGTGMGRPV